MLSGVCFGTNDLERAEAFYDPVLATISMIRLDGNDNEIGSGPKGGLPTFWILVPFNREQATHGNGAQVIFEASDADSVDRFHRTAVKRDGADEGAPGIRDHTSEYSGAYCRDLDKNKLHVVAMLRET